MWEVQIEDDSEDNDWKIQRGKWTADGWSQGERDEEILEIREIQRP